MSICVVNISPLVLHTHTLTEVIATVYDHIPKWMSLESPGGSHTRCFIGILVRCVCAVAHHVLSATQLLSVMF